MIWTNIDTPSLAYINKGGTNNSIQIDLGENFNAQGAVVTVKTPTRTLTNYVVTGEGLASDQTALVHFGLGKEASIAKLTVRLANGKEIKVINPKINSIVDLKEKVKSSTLLEEAIEVLETENNN